MKKIITLLFCVGAFAASFAQYNSGHKADRYVYNDDNHFGGNFSPNDKAFQIEKINRDYDFKIRQIQNSWNLGRHQRKVIIRNLEKERNRQIRIVNMRFRDRKSGYDYHRHGR